MKIDRRDIEGLIKSGGGKFDILLFYGPDEGLALERAKLLTLSVLGVQDDPFRLVELSSETLLKDPALLADEAQALAMTGGRKLIRISASDSLAPVLASYLTTQKSTAGQGALLVLLGGDLGAKSALRKIAEQSDAIACIACYRDNNADLVTLIRKQLQENGIMIDADALTYIGQNLGEDRGVTRAEIEKLILYAGQDRKPIALSDAMEVIGDRSAFALEDLLFSVTEGDHKQAERFLNLNLTEQNPISVLRALSRHLIRLHICAARLSKGERSTDIVSSLRPPLFWTVKTRFEKQMQNLSPDWLARAIDRLGSIEAEMLRHYPLAETLLRRLIFQLAHEARRGAIAA